MTEQTPMTQEQLNAIQERVDAATRGPWAHDFCGNVDQVETQAHATGTRIADNLTPGDADLIAHAPQDLTDLLAEVERLRDFESIVSWRYGDTTDGRTREDMVERAARVLRDKTRINDMTGDDSLWQELPEVVRIAWRNDAYSILNAALGTGEGA